jgi:transposase-like protein
VRIGVEKNPADGLIGVQLGPTLISQGQSVADAIRALGVSSVTYYRWRREFGGLKSDQVRRMKDLETENTRLRKAIADLTLDKLILQEASRGNF